MGQLDGALFWHPTPLETSAGAGETGARGGGKQTRDAVGVPSGNLDGPLASSNLHWRPPYWLRLFSLGPRCAANSHSLTPMRRKPPLDPEVQIARAYLLAPPQAIYPWAVTPCLQENRWQLPFRE